MDEKRKSRYDSSSSSASSDDEIERKPKRVVNAAQGEPSKPTVQSYKPAHYVGILEERRCTDIPFLLLFTAFWTSTYVCEYKGANWDTNYYPNLGSNEKTSSQAGLGPCYVVELPTTALLHKCFPKSATEFLSSSTNATIKASKIKILTRITNLFKKERNAYIMVAIKGTNYCKSASRGVSLLVSNALRVIAVTVVGDIVIFLGKLLVGAGSGVCAFYMAGSKMYTDPEKSTYLSSPILPVLLSSIIGFLLGHIFMQVYEMAIDTVFLCFCEDCEQHDANPVCAPDTLLHAVGASRKI